MNKRCSVCKVEKPREAFGPDRRSPTGLQPNCRACKQARRRVDPAKSARLQKTALRASLKASGLWLCNTCDRTLPQSDFGAANGKMKYQCRKCASEQQNARAKTPAGHEYSRITSAKRRALASEAPKIKARHVARRALLTGKIVKSPCEHCGDPKSVMHHYLGYAPENWLSVQWLCTACHYRAHHAMAC